MLLLEAVDFRASLSDVIHIRDFRPELTDMESEAMHARIDQLIRLYESRSAGAKDVFAIPLHLLKDKNMRERFNLYLRLV